MYRFRLRKLFLTWLLTATFHIQTVRLYWISYPVRRIKFTSLRLDSLQIWLNYQCEYIHKMHTCAHLRIHYNQTAFRRKGECIYYYYYCRIKGANANALYPDNSITVWISVSNADTVLDYSTFIRDNRINYRPSKRYNIRPRTLPMNNIIFLQKQTYQKIAIRVENNGPRYFVPIQIKHTFAVTSETFRIYSNTDILFRVGIAYTT